MTANTGEEQQLEPEPEQRIAQLQMQVEQLEATVKWY